MNAMSSSFQFPYHNDKESWCHKSPDGSVGQWQPTAAKGGQKFSTRQSMKTKCKMTGQEAFFCLKSAADCSSLVQGWSHAYVIAATGLWCRAEQLSLTCRLRHNCPGMTSWTPHRSAEGTLWEMYTCYGSPKQLMIQCYILWAAAFMENINREHKDRAKTNVLQKESQSHTEQFLKVLAGKLNTTNYLIIIIDFTEDTNTKKDAATLKHQVSTVDWNLDPHKKPQCTRAWNLKKYIFSFVFVLYDLNLVSISYMCLFYLKKKSQPFNWLQMKL